jgi:hypothetical protein
MEQDVLCLRRFQWQKYSVHKPEADDDEEQDEDCKQATHAQVV